MTGKESRKQKKNLEHLECSHQPHIQGRGAEERTQRAVNFNGWPRGCGAPNRPIFSQKLPRMEQQSTKKQGVH